MTLLAYSFFPALMLLLFGGLAATWIHLAGRPDGHVEEIASRIGLILLGVYLIWIALLTVIQRQVPILTFGQLSAFLGFLVWASQSYVQTRIRQRLLVILPVSAVILLILVGIVAGLQPSTLPKAVIGSGAAFHITLSLAGVAMLLGSGVYGAGSLVLSRQIAQRAFGPLFTSLPSLDDMNRLRKVAVYWGWILISVSLASAMIWMRFFRTESPIMESHLHPMITLWIVVSLLAAAARFNWLRRHRLAGLSVGLAVLVMVLVLVSVIEIFAGKWL
jgi:ABC-type uncharacterized transport system permease subunit